MERLLLFHEIEERCEVDKELDRDMASFFGVNLLDKLPFGNHWWSWNKRLPNLMKLIFGNGSGST